MSIRYLFSFHARDYHPNLSSTTSGVACPHYLLLPASTLTSFTTYSPYSSPRELGNIKILNQALSLPGLKSSMGLKLHKAENLPAYQVPPISPTLSQATFPNSCPINHPPATMATV
jgi:hypothetical protein